MTTLVWSCPADFIRTLQQEGRFIIIMNFVTKKIENTCEIDVYSLQGMQIDNVTYKISADHTPFEIGEKYNKRKLESIKFI